MSFSQQLQIAAPTQQAESRDPNDSTETVLTTSTKTDTIIHRNHYESVVVRGKAHAHVGDVIIDQQHTYNVVQYVKCTKQHEGNCESNINGAQQTNPPEHDESSHPSIEDTTSEIRAIFDRLLYCVKDVEYSSKDLIYSSKDLIHNSEKIIHVTGNVLNITQNTISSTQVALSSAQDTMTHAASIALSARSMWEIQEQISTLKEKVEISGIILSMISNKPWRDIWDYADFRFSILYLTKAARAGLRWLLPDLISPEVSDETALERYINERKAGSRQSITYSQAALFRYERMQRNQQANLSGSIWAIVTIAKHIFCVVTLFLALRAILEDFTSLVPRQLALGFAVGSSIGQFIVTIWTFYNGDYSIEGETRGDAWRRLVSLNSLGTFFCWYLWVVFCSTVYLQNELFVMTVDHEPVKQVCRTRYYDHEWISWLSHLSSTFASLVKAQRKCEAHNWPVNTVSYCPANVRRVDLMVNGTWFGIWCEQEHSWWFPSW